MSYTNRDIRLAVVTLHLARYICAFFDGQPDERLKELPSCPQGLRTRDIRMFEGNGKAREHNERDLDDFFENAAVGLHWLDRDGIILRATGPIWSFWVICEASTSATISRSSMFPRKPSQAYAQAPVGKGDRTRL